MTPQAYIAGPYSAENPANVRANVWDALHAGIRAAKAGYLPIVPHSMGPHHGVSWEEAMTRCRDLIRGLEPGRDILVAMPTWADSRGAREEVGLAIELRIPVVQLADLQAPGV